MGPTGPLFVKALLVSTRKANKTILTSITDSRFALFASDIAVSVLSLN